MTITPDLVLVTLNACGGNVTHAATALGYSSVRGLRSLAARRPEIKEVIRSNAAKAGRPRKS